MEHQQQQQRIQIHCNKIAQKNMNYVLEIATDFRP